VRVSLARVREEQVENTWSVQYAPLVTAATRAPYAIYLMYRLGKKQNQGRKKSSRRHLITRNRIHYKTSPWMITWTRSPPGSHLDESHVWFEDQWMVASWCDEWLTTWCRLILAKYCRLRFDWCWYRWRTSAKGRRRWGLQMWRRQVGLVRGTRWPVLTVDYRIKVHMDLQADKSLVVVKGPFFP
jgi:hypothetical protein